MSISYFLPSVKFNIPNMIIKFLHAHQDLNNSVNNFVRYYRDYIFWKCQYYVHIWIYWQYGKKVIRISQQIWKKNILYDVRSFEWQKRPLMTERHPITRENKWKWKFTHQLISRNDTETFHSHRNVCMYIIDFCVDIFIYCERLCWI